jgi:NAD(P) transhydrogenase subunit beta
VTPVWAQLGYLVAAVCFVLALKGLSSPRTARRGNLIGAAGAALAVVVVLASEDLDHVPAVLAAMVVGCVVGVPAARAVAMTAMPQLVALFNGVGGAAAALVALLELGADDGVGPVLLGAVAFTVLVGSVSFSGSCLTFTKLQELMTTRPVIPPGGRVVVIAAAAAAVVAAVVVVVTGQLWVGVVLGVLGLVLGVLLVLPVGGADVPIVISLLNAFTGLTVAASGYLLGNVLLLVAGTLVGASGTLLTRLMASAMGRSVAGTLFGAFRGGSTAGGGEESDRPVRVGSAEDVAILLGYANQVVVVPGYGLAVAQAQHALRELADLLAGRGVRVSYGMHPVAGRMPGHMNVLLAEANVPYEQLVEMERANGALPSTDVALVVGANDVVNPAARDVPGSPIYGMPILDVDAAQAVVFLKRSMRPGFAGIDNSLLYDPKTTLLFGDAKASLTSVVAAVKSL